MYPSSVCLPLSPPRSNRINMHRSLFWFSLKRMLSLSDGSVKYTSCRRLLPPGPNPEIIIIAVATGAEAGLIDWLIIVIITVFACCSRITAESLFATRAESRSYHRHLSLSLPSPYTTLKLLSPSLSPVVTVIYVYCQNPCSSRAELSSSSFARAEIVSHHRRHHFCRHGCWMSFIGVA